jgi:hypothetical protein
VHALHCRYTQGLQGGSGFAPHTAIYPAGATTAAARLPAGVLALLLEAGEAQTAVAAGEEWLSTHRRDTRARDVALTTALAHRSVAEMHARKQGDALTAAGMLEVACELLKRHRAAPQLQQEVAGALAELQPALACQLVALPLERFQERERGVKVRSHLYV